MFTKSFRLDLLRVDSLIDMAIEEDIGTGDLTSSLLIPYELNITTDIKANESCICAGLPIIEKVINKIDNNIKLINNFSDGDFIHSGQTISTINGNARNIFSIERIILNFLQRLSGIATESRKYYDIINNLNSKIKILDTRKTTPGYRNLDKYAVYISGCSNHRMGLYDEILVKDNHINCLINNGLDYTEILNMISNIIINNKNINVIVEVDTLDKFKEILHFDNINRVLLDNMSISDIKKAIILNKNKLMIEISGGINENSIKKFSKLDINFISVGKITHSAKSIDISMEISQSAYKI